MELKGAGTPMTTSRLREPVSGLTHLGAAVVSLVGLLTLLLTARGTPVRIAGLAVYGATLVLMFSSSAVYHLVTAGPRVVLFLRKLDHAAIYLLIAGTYTPICLTFFTGFWGSGFLILIWSLAAVGVGVKLFVIRAPRWVTAGVYLLMGWLALAAVGEILARMPSAAFAWLLAGGAFFTVGAAAYILKWPNPAPPHFGFHEIWHVLVILGAASHFVVMMAYVAPGGG